MVNASSEEIALESWIDRAKALDPEAVGIIASIYSSRLYGFMYRMTRHGNDAEELVQEVFVRVMRTLGNYRHEGRFDAWLFTIAANIARDALRKKNRSPMRSAAAMEIELAQAPAAKRWAMASDAAEVSDERIRLAAAIDRLPEHEREAVLLRHYGELEFSDIARLMGTPVGTALARAHRGLAKLRAILEASS